ncbi:Hypothetical protein CINCED_3A004952 [Cinara cedri]|uniref:Uncharacterized protein n=1 Tax=Cinara cedri TaxID=506608 RepID=A0A5E4MWP2_9HEMI|nr:Hypothetical protein CINCED_3A004952 [Cinara cedri]
MFPGVIDYYRRFCQIMLVVLLTSRYYHVTTSITVSDRDDFDGQDANDDADTLSEKAGDGDAENKHFMDVYSLKSGPQQLEFGHVFEDPNVWEQRYEKKDFDSQRHQGQVKWGDKDGSYGEQYWDLNHGGAGESAYDNGENGPYESSPPESGPYEPSNWENGQESRHTAVVYKPLVVTFTTTNKSNKKSPTAIVRNARHKNMPNNKLQQMSEPTATTTTAKPMTTGRSANDKKTAPVLVFDMKTGVVMDEATGNKFVLKPIDD